MPRHKEQKTLAFAADELFSVVADVKEYPSFVPWCTSISRRPVSRSKRDALELQGPTVQLFRSDSVDGLTRTASSAKA